MTFKQLFINLRNYPYTYLYIAYIVLLNTIFSYIPDFHLGGYDVSLADFVVGLIYVMRDLAQREAKHGVLLAMLVACAISYLLAEKQEAIASVAAFVAGEGLDWAIFTFTKKPMSQRILLSALISSPVDSVVNLYFLDMLDPANFLIMLVMKSLGVLALWYLWRRKDRAALKIV